MVEELTKKIGYNGENHGGVVSPSAVLLNGNNAAPSQADRHEVCVLEALQQSASDLGVGCFDLRLIEAERLYRE